MPIQLGLGPAALWTQSPGMLPSAARAQAHSIAATHAKAPRSPSPPGRQQRFPMRELKRWLRVGRLDRYLATQRRNPRHRYSASMTPLRIASRLFRAQPFPAAVFFYEGTIQRSERAGWVCPSTARRSRREPLSISTSGRQPTRALGKSAYRSLSHISWPVSSRLYPRIAPIRRPPHDLFPQASISGERSISRTPESRRPRKKLLLRAMISPALSSRSDAHA